MLTSFLIEKYQKKKAEDLKNKAENLRAKKKQYEKIQKLEKEIRELTRDVEDLDEDMNACVSYLKHAIRELDRAGRFLR